MAVRDTSLIALERIKDRLEPNQQAVYEILLELGPTHDRRILEALNQKEQVTLKPKAKKRTWEINSVTARRNDLLNMGLIIDLGSHKGTWRGDNKTYHIWRITGDDRQPIGWKPMKLKVKKAPSPQEIQQCKEHIQQIRQRAEQPILEKIRVHEAAYTLATHRHRYKKPKPQEALLFA